MLQEAGHIKNIVVLIFRHIQCLHLMNSEAAWVLVSSGTQVLPQIILDPDYLPDYLSVSYDYALTEAAVKTCSKKKLFWKFSKNSQGFLCSWVQVTVWCAVNLRKQYSITNSFPEHFVNLHISYVKFRAVSSLVHVSSRATAQCSIAEISLN